MIATESLSEAVSSSEVTSAVLPTVGSLSVVVSTW